MDFPPAYKMRRDAGYKGAARGRCDGSLSSFSLLAGNSALLTRLPYPHSEPIASFSISLFYSKIEKTNRRMRGYSNEYFNCESIEPWLW